MSEPKNSEAEDLDKRIENFRSSNNTHENRPIPREKTKRRQSSWILFFIFIGIYYVAIISDFALVDFGITEAGTLIMNLVSIGVFYWIGKKISNDLYARIKYTIYELREACWTFLFFGFILVVLTALDGLFVFAADNILALFVCVFLALNIFRVPERTE